MAATVLRMPDDTATRAQQRRAQRTWSAVAVAERLRVVKKARHALTQMSMALVDAISPELSRTRADTYVAEVLPLLAACEFLEREAEQILAPRRLGPDGLPFWLGGVDTVVERVALGTVLVIGPSNYPLFLPGVQVLQALAAGNAAMWKPGRGGAAVAEVFAAALEQAGLPNGLLRVTDESAQAGVRELRAGVDKVIFTGSAQAGREVMKIALETVTPVIAELSGCDAVIVLPSADTVRVVAALKFGMRLNGSATCMAPRRLVLVGDGHEALLEKLRTEFAATPGVRIGEAGRARLNALLDDARHQGATICGNTDLELVRPLLILDGKPEMAIAQADVFAPILTVLHIADADEMRELDEVCPFGLTASIFGDESQAREVGNDLCVGTVVVNDLIVPTADPRIAFGGRRGSGFGVTRGREGLLEMTAVKTTAVRKSKAVRHYQETGDAHEAMFAGVVAMSHAQGLRARWQGLKQTVSAAMRLR